MDVCEKIIDGQFERSKPDLLDRLTGYCMANIRTLKRKFKAHLPRAQKKPEFHRHRYPEISLEEIQGRTLRFQQVLGDSKAPQVKQLYGQFYQVRS